MEDIAELLESTIRRSEEVREIRSDIRLIRQHIAYVRYLATEGKPELLAKQKKGKINRFLNKMFAKVLGCWWGPCFRCGIMHASYEKVGEKIMWSSDYGIWEKKYKCCKFCEPSRKNR